MFYRFGVNFYSYLLFNFTKKVEIKFTSFGQKFLNTKAQKKELKNSISTIVSEIFLSLVPIWF